MKYIVAVIVGGIACFLYYHFTDDRSISVAVMTGVVSGFLVNTLWELLS